MHDPLTVAFEIRRPWPETADWRTKQAARDGVRWRFNSPFWVLAGRGLYFPPLVTVWHHDPSGYSATTCPVYPGRSWRFHVHHWRLQVHPFQHLRRRLLTRCTWCGGRSVKGDAVCVSHAWDGSRARWWQGEPGLFHADCSSIKRAHSTCTCETPALNGRNYGRCAECDRFRPFGFTDANLARARELQMIPQSGRRASARETPTPDAVDELARLREGLHKFRYALDSRAGRETTTDFIRALFNEALPDPGEPCDRDEQYARAEAAEAAVARARAEAARIRATTRTWEPVADLIDAALDGTPRPGKGDAPRLLDCGFCYEEQGEEVHPHPECPIGGAASTRSPLRERIMAAVRPLMPEVLHPRVAKIGAQEITGAVLTVTLPMEAALNRVRALHRPADYRGLAICVECSGFDGESCDNSPCGYEHCPTLVALANPVREQPKRPTHPDGTPYSYYEITAEGWGFCDGCRMWSTATPDRPHQCAEPHMQGPIDSKEAGDA